MVMVQNAKIVRNGNSRAINLNHILIKAHNLKEGDLVEVKLKKLMSPENQRYKITDKSFGGITGSSKVFRQLRNPNE